MNELIICLIDFSPFIFTYILAESPRGRPRVEPMEQTVDEGAPSQIRCYVPEQPDAKLKWRNQGGQLPADATVRDGILYIPRTEIGDAGNYICTMVDSRGEPVDSVPARIYVKQRTQFPGSYFFK